jgi:hypothetical protein
MCVDAWVTPVVQFPLFISPPPNTLLRDEPVNDKYVNISPSSQNLGHMVERMKCVLETGSRAPLLRARTDWGKAPLLVQRL